MTSLLNRIQWKGFEKLPSAWFLIVVNLIPVFGVFFLGWDAGNVIVLYWLENLAIGAVNVLKILTAKKRMGSMDELGRKWQEQTGEQIDPKTQQVIDMAASAHSASRAFLAPFFLIPLRDLHHGPRDVYFRPVCQRWQGWRSDGGVLTHGSSGGVVAAIGDSFLAGGGAFRESFVFFFHQLYREGRVP